MATMTEVVEGLATKPPTPEEVERARGHELKEWDLTLRNTERLARTLSEWTATGDWRLMFVHRDRIEAVKPADVSRVAAAYFGRNNRTSGIYVPTAEPERVAIPEAPALAGIVDGYKGRAAMAAGEEFEATPANIESRVKRSALASGLKLADGWLTARELYQASLRGATVVLSGCDTGRAVVGAGDETWGLVRAFLAAGARRLAMSLWPVHDESAVELMSHVYGPEGLGSGRSELAGSMAGAFRRASDRIRETRPHAAAWAAFMQVGEI